MLRNLYYSSTIHNVPCFLFFLREVFLQCFTLSFILTCSSFTSFLSSLSVCLSFYSYIYLFCLFFVKTAAQLQARVLYVLSQLMPTRIVTFLPFLFCSFIYFYFSYIAKWTCYLSTGTASCLLTNLFFGVIF